MDMKFGKVTDSPLIQILQNSHAELHKKSTNNQSTGQFEREKLADNKVVHKGEVQTVVSKMNEFIEPLRTNLKFVLHDELNEYYVTIVNPHTNEVIKEIPPKKMLDMYAAMAELMGIFIDQKI